MYEYSACLVPSQSFAMCQLAASTGVGSVSGYNSWACINGAPITSVCQWTGVTCLSKTVAQIVLSKLPLHGSISTSIGLLSSLNSLVLSGDGLTGSIPNAIGNLPFLSVLDLSSNQLMGSIPQTVAGLRLWVTTPSGAPSAPHFLPWLNSSTSR